MPIYVNKIQRRLRWFHYDVCHCNIDVDVTVYIWTNSTNIAGHVINTPQLYSGQLIRPALSSTLSRASLSYCVYVWHQMTVPTPAEEYQLAGASVREKAQWCTSGLSVHFCLLVSRVKPISPRWRRHKDHSSIEKSIVIFNEVFLMQTTTDMSQRK